MCDISIYHRNEETTLKVKQNLMTTMDMLIDMSGSANSIKEQDAINSSIVAIMRVLIVLKQSKTAE